jgi:hypothetical protein
MIMVQNELSEIYSYAFKEQYGAAIRMLGKSVRKCPEEVWDDKADVPPYWHIAYHAMWFLDWYLSDSKEARESFKSKFGEESSQDLNKTPEITLTPEQLLDYLSDIKEKAKHRFTDITPDDLIEPSIFEWHGNSVLSSILYNLRHVMNHIGALNLRLRQKGVKLDSWVTNRRI